MKLLKVIFVSLILVSFAAVCSYAVDPNNRKEGAAWGDLKDKKAAIKAQNIVSEAARNANPISAVKAKSKADKDAGAAARAANEAQKAAIQAANVARGRPAGNS